MEHIFKMVPADVQATNKTTDTDADAYGPAPELKPLSDDYTVNVVNTFPWTNSPILIPGKEDDWLNPRYDIPGLKLREETIQLNPALNNIARNLYNIKQGGAAITSFLEENKDAAALIGAMGAYRFMKSVDSQSDLLKLAAIAGGGAALANAPNIAKNIGSVIGDLAGEDPATKVKPKYLKPYAGLYNTKKTGFIYKLPYLTDKQRELAATWSESSAKESGAWGGEMLEKFSSGARKLATTAIALNAPGVYIDMAKSYNYGTVKSYTVDFPLINTQSQEDLVRNWEFLYLLTYQNLPNRIDRIQVSPPKLYESIIRGVWYSRYSFISRMTIDFVGTRRKMTIPIPKEMDDDAGRAANKSDKKAGKLFKKAARMNKRGKYGKAARRSGRANMALGTANTIRYQNIDTVIPDAYQVSITMTELVPESQNTLFAAIMKPETNPDNWNVDKDVLSGITNRVGKKVGAAWDSMF